MQEKRDHVRKKKTVQERRSRCKKAKNNQKKKKDIQERRGWYKEEEQIDVS